MTAQPDSSTTAPATGSTAPEAPQEPAAAAPATPASPPEAPPADGGEQTPQKANPWDDPATAKAEIERLRRENGSARTNAKAQAAEDARNELAQQIGKALGFVKDDAPIDAAQLTEQLATSQTEAKDAKVALAVYMAAADAGGDPARLLDSSTFQAKVAGLDPTDSAAIAAAIQSEVAAKPWLAATPVSRVPAPHPATGSSGSGEPPTLTTEQQIAQLEAEGKHAEAGRLKAQQLRDLRDDARR